MIWSQSSQMWSWFKLMLTLPPDSMVAIVVIVVDDADVFFVAVVVDVDVVVVVDASVSDSFESKWC